MKEIMCKTCEYYYKEHCANGASEYCTEPVKENFVCDKWEEIICLKTLEK